VTTSRPWSWRGSAAWSRRPEHQNRRWAAVWPNLEKMSIEEKIRIMEAIWDDLRRKAESISSPSWHEEVLKEREAGIKKGGEEFIDWSSAKRNI
jgi:hypothetical protein